MTNERVTMYQVLYGFDGNNKDHIFVIVVLRKLLLDLAHMRTYYNHIPNIISYVNAIISKNINMIHEETRYFEEDYLRNNEIVFAVHPMELIKSILDKNNQTVQLFRNFLNEVQINDIGYNVCLNIINSWLLTVNLDTYHRVVKDVYS